LDCNGKPKYKRVKEVKKAVTTVNNDQPFIKTDPDNKVGENNLNRLASRSSDVNAVLESKRELPSVLKNKWEFNRRSYKRFGPLLEPTASLPKGPLPGEKSNDDEKPPKPILPVFGGSNM
jgi:hypothetical protein